MSKNNNNGSYDKPPYEVGYGKPPKNTQFRKGQSGNKAGRPKNKNKSLNEMIDKAFYADRPLRINGKIVNKSAMEITLRKLSEMGMQGNIKAADLMISLSGKYSSTAQEMEFIAPYIPTRMEMKAMDPDFNDDNL